MTAPVLGFGFWAITFGVKGGLLDKEGIKVARQILGAAQRGAINLFEDAEISR